MYLDPEGIARVCRWDGHAEQAGHPNWKSVIERYRNNLDNAEDVLHQFGHLIERLPTLMRESKVDDDIIEHRTLAIQAHANQLLAL